jgi:hypothetical protein
VGGGEALTAGILEQHFAAQVDVLVLGLYGLSLAPHFVKLTAPSRIERNQRVAPADPDLTTRRFDNPVCPLGYRLRGAEIMGNPVFGELNSHHLCLRSIALYPVLEMTNISQ